MKPKRELTKCRTTICVKNPFRGTIVTHINFREEDSVDYIASEISKVISDMKMDFINYNWQEWFERKKMIKKWGFRKCMNFIRSYFELTPQDEKVLRNYAERADVLPVSLIEKEGD